MTKRPAGRTAAEILADVDAKAAAIISSTGPCMSEAKARAEVWRQHPELADELRKAQATEKT